MSTNTQRHEAKKPLLAKDFAQDHEDIRFLFEQRLALFNIRREHEWKIYFGAMALLGAGDASLITGHLSSVSIARYVWSFGCLLVWAAVFGYQRDLQIRNRADRTAMNGLFNLICEAVLINHDEVAERPTRNSFLRPYGYAFRWQMLILFFVALVSSLLPWVIAAQRDSGQVVKVSPSLRV
jgi:hypothetical protein